MKKIPVVLILLLVAVVSCATKYKNMKSFETVWQTIIEKHIDPTFSGLNWSEVHDRYQPLIAAAKNEEEFYLLVNKMLFELNISHNAVVPPDDLGQIDPILSAEGSIGIDVRMIEGNAVITSVKSGSVGDQAGLRSGYIIKSIDGIDIEKILVKDRVLLWRYEGRDKTWEAYLEPADSVYEGPVVVMVDHLSISSAEEFSGGLKAIKRATIVGERTPGVVVTANFEKLPNGATFVYPKAWTITADGTVLERHGVVPDIEVALDRNELLKGKDTQLEAAVDFLSKRINK